MRIEPSSAGIAAPPIGPAHASQVSRATANRDHVELSAFSQAAAGPSAQRLGEIQSVLRSGAYQVDAGEVSRRIVDFYLIPLE